MSDDADPTELRWSWLTAAALVAAMAAVLGGAFTPLSRIGVGFGLAIVLACLGERLLSPLRRSEAAALVFLGWAVASAVISGRAPLDAKVAITGWMVAWALWMASRRSTDGERTQVLGVFIAGACVITAGVVVEFAVMRTPGCGGLLENPNVAASLLVPVLVVVLFGSRPRLPWWSWLVAAWLVAGVLLTGSRAGAMAIGLVIVLALPRGRWRAVGGVLATACVVLLIGWRFVLRSDPLAWHRIEIWEAVLRLWQGTPLAGVGPGALREAAGVVRIPHPELIGHYQRMISYAESSPLAVLVLTGVVGLILALLTLSLWLGEVGWRSRESARIGALLASIAVLSAFHDQLEVEIVLWWWAMIVGLLEVGDAHPPPLRCPAAARATFAVTIAGVVLWGLVSPAIAREMLRQAKPTRAAMERLMTVEPWFIEPALYRSRHLLQNESWTWENAAEALHLSRRALAASPGQARAWANLARVQTRIAFDLGAWPKGLEEAREAYAEACLREPYLPWYWGEQAQLERSVGDLEAARSLLLRALEAEPHYVTGRLFLARLELDLGRVEEARRALDQALASTVLAEGRLLTRYERDLLTAPPGQLRRLQEALQ